MVQSKPRVRLSHSYLNRPTGSTLNDHVKWRIDVTMDDPNMSVAPTPLAAIRRYWSKGGPP